MSTRAAHTGQARATHLVTRRILPTQTVMITPPAGSQTQITCNYMPEDTTRFPGFPGFVQLQEAGALMSLAWQLKQHLLI